MSLVGRLLRVMRVLLREWLNPPGVIRIETLCSDRRTPLIDSENQRELYAFDAQLEWFTKRRVLIRPTRPNEPGYPKAMWRGSTELVAYNSVEQFAMEQMGYREAFTPERYRELREVEHGGIR